MSVQTEHRPGPLPRGRHRLSRAEVESSQHDRLCGAALQVIGELGYTATTVADIVGRAQVARRTFYAMFSGKDECFAAACDFGIAVGLDRLSRAIERTQSTEFRERVRVNFRGYLDVLAAQPAVTRALYLETLVAGEALVGHRARMHRLFAEYLLDTARVAVESGELSTAPDPELIDMLLGGIDDRIRDCLHSRGVAGLPDLAPLFTRAVLVLVAPD